MDARDIPPEVSAAIGRIRIGGGTQGDQQTIAAFLAQNQDTLTAGEMMALGELVGSLDAAPTGPTQPAMPFNYVPGGGDIRSQVAAQSSAPANMPTPQPPPLTSTSAQIPTSPNDPMMRGGSPQSLVGNRNVASISAMPPDMPSMPPISSADFAPGGVGASNIQRRAARQAQRGEARSQGGAQGRGANWKMIEGMNGSAFGDVNPAYLQAYASNPAMAAREIAGPNASLTASAMQPLVGSALAMAQTGLLGGGRGHGLGGPASAGQQLQRAEGLVNSLGPGQYVDPGSVLRQTMRRARKTPLGDLYSGQGDPNDINQQIATTQNAILSTLQGVATEEAYNGTQAMLDQEAMAWLDEVAHGTIDPNQVSYPEYLRQHKRQKFLGR